MNSTVSFVDGLSTAIWPERIYLRISHLTACMATVYTNLLRPPKKQAKSSGRRPNRLCTRVVAPEKNQPKLGSDDKN